VRRECHRNADLVDQPLNAELVVADVHGQGIGLLVYDDDGTGTVCFNARKQAGRIFAGEEQVRKQGCASSWTTRRANRRPPRQSRGGTALTSSPSSSTERFEDGFRRPL
jgi:hypothetical protein